MTCNVFSGTLNPTQSVSQPVFCPFVTDVAAACLDRQEKCSLIVELPWSTAVIRPPTQTAGTPCSLSCLKD